MENEIGLGEFGNVNHSESPMLVPDSNLPNSGFNCGQGLPVVRINPLLNKIEQMACPPPRHLRELSKHLE